MDPIVSVAIGLLFLIVLPSVIFALGFIIVLKIMILLIPIFIMIYIGNMLGLLWYQSVMIGLISYVIIQIISSIYFKRHFKKHADEFNLPHDLIGRQIEVEGKLTTIYGSTKRGIMVKRKDEFFAKCLDPNFVRQKISRGD